MQLKINNGENQQSQKLIVGKNTTKRINKPPVKLIE